MSIHRARPTCEPLEDRTLPAASVSGLPTVEATSGLVLLDLETGKEGDLPAPRGVPAPVYWRRLVSELRGPSTECLVDLNDDGRLDRVVAGPDRRVRVFLGQESGGFGSEINGGEGFGVGAGPADVAVA